MLLEQYFVPLLTLVNLKQFNNMTPKGFRTNININPSKIGVERREEILHEITDNSTFLPRGVYQADMDASFVEYIKNDLNIVSEGLKLGVYLLTIQRWSEFTKTWRLRDDNEETDIKMPFITIVRKPDTQVGTNQAGLWNIAGGKTYTYMKVPTFDGSRSGFDTYKIPQPTSVDITYEVRIFTNKMKDLNTFNTKIHKAFQSRQSYISVKGHPMPLTLENISDESSTEDFENRRFYVQLFEIKLAGYILDEEDFDIIPTINRVYNFIEVNEFKPNNGVIFDRVIKNNSLFYSFVFKPKSSTIFSFNAKYALRFTQINGLSNINRVVIALNNTIIFDGTVLNTPIDIAINDLITITVHKDIFIQVGKFELLGNTL